MDQRIADEFGVTGRQVSAAVALFGGGATVPYIARYRKEATGVLDDAQLRTLTRKRAINTGNEGSLTDT